MALHVALVGNPNSGKSTLFNELTGAGAHVGNFPGVTVARKEGIYRKDGLEATLIDLPGIYSTSPYSPEEVVTRDYLLLEKPDVIIDIVDVTNIERNLYLTTQLMEVGKPIVVALNMMDMAEKAGTTVEVRMLEDALGVPVRAISASKRTGLDELMKAVVQAAKNPPAQSVLKDRPEFPFMTSLARVLTPKAQENAMFYAIKMMEGDDVARALHLSGEEEEVAAALVHGAQDQGLHHDHDHHKEHHHHDHHHHDHHHMQHHPFEEDLQSRIADARYRFITTKCGAAIRKNPENVGINTSDRIDGVLTHRLWGLPIFALIMLLVFQITFGEEIAGIPLPGVFLQGQMEMLVALVTDGMSWFLESLGAASWAHSLVIDGMFAGVGAVFSFLPQMMLIFLFLSLMESSGYMARAAFMMDRIFRKFGLSGKSFVPLLMGFGCSVPAIMAARTIENDKDRRLTILLTPFMSCGAKLPIYTLLGAALFASHQGWVVFSLYVLGITVAVISGLVLNKFVLRGDSAPFIMELPPYRMPTLKNTLLALWDKLKHFLIKAGTLLLCATIIIWFLRSFDFSLHMVTDDVDSIIGSIGKCLAPVFALCGFGTWQASIAIITGMVAKEAVVSTLGVLYGGGAELAGEGATLATTAMLAAFSPLSALAFMAFNLLAPPCLAAISTLSQEMRSGKWTAFALLFQFCVAWSVSFLIFQVGSLLHLG